MNANFNLVRNDTLPEYSNYVDNGCDLFDGNMKSYKNWINPQINPTNQDKNKDQECFFI